MAWSPRPWPCASTFTFPAWRNQLADERTTANRGILRQGRRERLRRRLYRADDRHDCQHRAVRLRPDPRHDAAHVLSADSGVGAAALSLEHRDAWPGGH